MIWKKPWFLLFLTDAQKMAFPKNKVQCVFFWKKVVFVKSIFLNTKKTGNQGYKSPLKISRAHCFFRWSQLDCFFSLQGFWTRYLLMENIFPNFFSRTKIPMPRKNKIFSVYFPRSPDFSSLKGKKHKKHVSPFQKNLTSNQGRGSEKNFPPFFYKWTFLKTFLVNLA